MRNTLFIALFFSTFLYSSPRLEFEQTALDDYVHALDEAYDYKIIKTIKGDGYTTYIIDLTSQTFLTKAEINRPVWKHWLSVVYPDDIKHETAMLIIGGGDNDGKVLKNASDMSVTFATASNSIVAELYMVPNQPLTFTDETEPRWEDAFIAYTWDKYLTSGDNKWPARMAMTKSATAAMDAVQALTTAQTTNTVSKFVVTGASKRGWTTWTAGAVDSRVEAIIPVVIDMLNIEPSFEHHWEVYGFWAPAIQDYEDMKIMDWWQSEEMRSLNTLVDPISYKERYEMPKLMVNAAGDEFFIPTSSQFYFDQLPAEKYLRYVPNANHSLDNTDALETILAFYASILNKSPRPKFSWQFGEDGSITVWSESKVKEVRMWSAGNKKARDFRKDTIGNGWRSKELMQQSDGSYKAIPKQPNKGWRAYFIELTYETSFGTPIKFTTPVRVTPNTLPFDYIPPEKPKRGFLSEE